MTADRLTSSPFPPYLPPLSSSVDDEHPLPPATLNDLTPRQLAVASMLAKGKSDKQIAAELRITVRRVSQHVDALEFLLHCDPGGNVRLQIALWWRDQVPAHLTYAA